MRIWRIALKFGPNIYSQDIDKKYRVRDFRFSKLISHNGLRRNTYRKLFDKQIWQNNFKATNRNMEKASHCFLD